MEFSDSVKSLFKGYRSMTKKVERQLVKLGIRVVRHRKHLILHVGTRMVSIPASGSDHRGGYNVAAKICRAIIPERS